MLLTSDFETNVSEVETSVWAWAICEIGNPDFFKYGTRIEDFMFFLEDSKENHKVWFHNLKFDGEFIFHYLLTHGFEWVKEKKDKKNKTFTSLISDKGQFYTIEVYFKVSKYRTNKVTFYDSLKILNFSVETIAKGFGLPISKLEIDYKMIREKNHILTQEEIDYIRNDVSIMSMALDIMFKQNLKKMTIGSNALSNYKETISSFTKYFPVLDFEIDSFIRESYKGGWVYLNPIYKEETLQNLIVIDKNSMHPSHMYYDKLPFGEPIYFIGKYTRDNLYDLYIQSFSCTFKLKEGKLPTIQLKNSSYFLPTEYVSECLEITTLTLTNIDLDLFFENYEVENIMWHGGYKFRSVCGLFRGYIDLWMGNKNKAKEEGNSALYLISKVMMNSLYGKFGKNPRVRGKYPYLEEGIVKYKLGEEEITDSIYCPVASFITAYSRDDIIRSSQKIREYSLEKYGKDYFVYSDTDSIHCLSLTEEELSSLLPLDEYKLNHYKVENHVNRAIFLRQKCYIEENYEGVISTTVAGLPKKLGKYINFDNFKKGFSVMASEEEKDHKLRFKHVKGGVVLVDTDFTIK